MSSVVNEMLVPFEPISGLYTTGLKRFKDDRGSFSETFRRAWFPMVNWDRMQMNRSESIAGVLRGLHYHFHQIDYWLVMRGTLRVGLADLRPNSPTFRQSACLDVSGEDGRGVFIPVGVAHGFYALTDVTLLYVVNNYYDGGEDERGVAWNDPILNVPWGAEQPILSDRDKLNRSFTELYEQNMLEPLLSIEG